MSGAFGSRKARIQTAQHKPKGRLTEMSGSKDLPFGADPDKIGVPEEDVHVESG
jgi:hypothetical protein